MAFLLIGLVQAITIGTGLEFAQGNTEYTFNADYTTENISFIAGGIVFGNYTIKINPEDNFLDVEIVTLITDNLNFTETPIGDTDTIEHNITAWTPTNPVYSYLDGVHEADTVADASGFFNITFDDYDGATSVFFGTAGTTTTTVAPTTTTTIAPTTTTLPATTTTTLAVRRLTPCLGHLATADLKESYKCLYIGENFQRSDGAPTLGYWFYLLVFGGMVFILWMKVKNIAIAGFTMLMFMGLFQGWFPPQAAATYWAVVVAAVAAVLVGLFKND